MLSKSRKFITAAISAALLIGTTSLPAVAVVDPCATTITKGSPATAVTNTDVTVTPPVSPNIYCVAQFKSTTSYSFTVPAGITKVDYLVVGAGGGGASGGGGGGGVLQGTDYSVTPGASIAISVGAGGAGGNGGSGQSGVHGGKGGSSTFAAITALGGGGGSSSATNNAAIQNGASGGGSRYDCVSAACGGGIAGTGTAGQGNNGGYSTYNSYGAGGGGGAGAGAAVPVRAAVEGGDHPGLRALGRAGGQRIPGARLARGQRPAAARPGLAHLDRPDRQRPVLDGGRAEHHDRLDAAGQLAPHPPAPAGAKGAGGRDQFPPRDGKLHAHRHACARHARPHHLCERRFLRNDRVERGRAGGRHRPLPLLARRGPRPAHAPARRRAQRPAKPGRLSGARQAARRHPV